MFIPGMPNWKIGSKRVRQDGQMSERAKQTRAFIRKTLKAGEHEGGSFHLKKEQPLLKKTRGGETEMERGGKKRDQQEEKGTDPNFQKHFWSAIRLPKT